MYRVFVKSELTGFIFPRLNLCNLTLLPEDYNDSQQQGFQSRQTKAIKVNFYYNYLIHYQQTGDETIALSWFMVLLI